MNAQNKYVSKSINLFLALLLVSITLLGGCAPASIDSEEPEPIEIEQDPTGGEQVPTEIPELSVGKGIQPVQELNTEMVLQDNVYKLEQQTVEAIREYHPESGEIIIPTNAPFVNQIQEGKIIVYGISDKTPEGLLRRVVSIEPDIVYVSKTADASRSVIRPKAIDVLKILTTLARLEDLFKEVHITDTWTLSCSNWIIEFTDNVSCKSEQIVASVNETLVDKYNSTIKANLNGTVFIRPTLHFDILIKDGLQQVTIENETTIDSKVTLTAEASFTAGEKVDIYTLRFKPQGIDVYGIPIVYRPVIKISVGADGKISTKINFSAENQATYKRIYTYNKGGSPIREEPKLTWSPIEFPGPELVTEFEAKAYVLPRLEIVFYEVVGLYAEAQVYLQLDVDPSKPIWWELKAGVVVTLGFEFEIFTDLLPHGERTVFEEEWGLDSAKEPAKEPEPPPPEPTEPPPPEPTEPPPSEPTEPPPPAGTGNENILIVYDNISAFVINLTQGSVRIKGLVFNRIDNQGNVTASYQADTWGNFYSEYDLVPSNYCPRIALPNSSTTQDCIVSVNYETSQDRYHFWRETSTSKQFEVWQNGTLLQTCEISAGSCGVYVPQP